MASYKAGQEIDAFCTKCKMDLLHKIVAVVSGKPVRVECRTCITTHAFRQVKGVKTPGAAPLEAPRTPRASAGTAEKRSKAPASLPPVIPPQGAHVVLYKLSERFAPASWIQHKTFGMGQVVREVPPNKIEVRFESGNRLLVHGQTE